MLRAVLWIIPGQTRRIVLFILLACLAIGFPFAANGQDTNIKHKSPDTLSGAKPQKRFGRAAMELGLGEVVPWVIDDYVTRQDWANISFKTMGNNLRPSSWAWDNDQFQTNEIGHPFHGSIFYNAFRSNGYSFWQSAPAAFAGSYLWETFGETQAPSINDFITTGFGGVMLGEVSHRMANKLTNNRTHGFKRQAGEVFALLINPSNGLTRLLDGKFGKPPQRSSLIDSTKMEAELDLGVRKYNVNNKDVFRDGHFGPYGRLQLSYGSPDEHMKDPFSNISIVIEAGKDDSSKLNMVNVYGSLTGWKIYAQNNTHLAVLSADYDYINNAAFFYSAEGVRMNLYSEFQLPGKFKINTSVGAGALILAAIPDHYTFNSRNYDYGPGLSYYGSVKISLTNRFFYNISYHGGWMATVNGNPSDYLLHVLTNNLWLNIIDGFAITAQEGYFNLHGTYRDFPPVNKTYPYLMLAISYKLEL
ncbi:MAG TPA: DUF3943 domain-containing protein [Mucilaginibacter sp.]|nr:DUF3943 domain-containing protein [Mucilaginibacter sp.]